MKKGTKILIWVLAALAVAAVAAFFIIRGKKASEGELILRTWTVEPTDISTSITATGTLEPVKEVEVGTQVSGIISKIYVDFNDEVKAGQLIAELDKSVLKQELASSQANLNSSKAEYDYQLANYNRSKTLHDDSLISDADFESAQYSYLRSKYAYQQAQSNYTKAKTNLGYAMIYSPIDGVVLNRAVDEGQTVASGFSTPTLFTIAQSLKEMRVIANIDEADIGSVQEGQRVMFEVDAYPDDQFNGTVEQVRLQATTTSNVVTYEVVIDAPNEDLKLKPGLTASIYIYTTDLKDVIAVPVRALSWTPEGMRAPFENCVWVMGPDGQPQAREVETGISDSIYTEILSGLEEGEQVVIGQALVNKKEAKPQQTGNNPFMPKRPQRGENKRTE